MRHRRRRRRGRRLGVLRFTAREKTKLLTTNKKVGAKQLRTANDDWMAGYSLSRVALTVGWAANASHAAVTASTPFAPCVLPCSSAEVSACSALLLASTLRRTRA